MLGLAITLLVIFVGVVVYYTEKKEFITHDKGIVIITGASTGIGRHAAEYLAKRSALHILAGVRKESDAAVIEELGVPNLKPLMIDVTSHESCVAAVENVKQIMKEKDLQLVGLVNNAGISRKIPVEFHAMEDVRKLMETNYFGVLDLTQLTLPLLRESKGRIIMISSIAGLVVRPLSGIYSSSKFALEALSDALRRELADHGVSVSVVEPGYVVTNIFASAKAAMQSVLEESGASEVVKSIYPKFYTDKARESDLKQIANAADPIVTSIAIEDSLISKYPKTRYPVAVVSGLSGHTVSWLVWLVSDRTVDFLFNLM